MQILPFLIRHFYRVERQIFYLERYERLLIGVFHLIKGSKKISNFWLKPRTNLLAKMQILPLFKFDIFIV